jgi:NADH-quinone oxidoreductase subunit G
MGGGEWAQHLSPGPDFNLRAFGQGDAIVVAASDLHEEAPVWWLRVKQAADRGARLVLVNSRRTRLDKHAQVALDCGVGRQPGKIEALVKALRDPGKAAKGLKDAALAISGSGRLAVFFGQEGLTGKESQQLAEECAQLFSAAGIADMANSGLIPVWPRANTQGAWDMGLRPAGTDWGRLVKDHAAYVMAADPAGDFAGGAEALRDASFVIVQDLFLTETAKLADVVFPAQAFIEREGTYTNGERRVQRLYKVLPALEGTRADWDIVSQVGRALGLDFDPRQPASVFEALASSAPGYQGLSYAVLAGFESQWPPVGGDDLYFGGTSHPNRQGVGIMLEASQQPPVVPDDSGEPKRGSSGEEGHVLLVPVTRLYDRAKTVAATPLLAGRLQPVQLEMHPEDAKRLHVEDGGVAEFSLADGRHQLEVSVHSNVPKGAALLPRSIGVPLEEPMWVRLLPADQKEQV